jgi:hypothetical protein
MKQTASKPGLLLGLLFNRKDGGDMFLQNVGSLLMGYMIR